MSASGAGTVAQPDLPAHQAIVPELPAGIGALAPP
jgi:hypothetical protein